MARPEVTVVMPVFNEADGLAEFIRELDRSMYAFAARFLVLDDCSTDDTAAVLGALVADGLPVEFVRSEVNRGHGPTTVEVLHAGLAHEPDLIVAIDGDGQFLGDDVARAVRWALDEDVDVVEGVRTDRSDPWFRHLTSASTRFLVRHRCGESPRDANTPLRVYQPEILKTLLEALPSESLTPNLLISVLSRRWGLTIAEIPVAHRDRRGLSPAGSTWHSRRRQVPSVRFLRFCALAITQWALLSRGSRL